MLTGNVEVFIPSNQIDMRAFGNELQSQLLIFTPFALDIKDLALRYGFEASTPASQQYKARADMRKNLQLKWILGSLIFLILVVNLQGSFANALKERRFEIGLRALGATPINIVIQFFVESTMLMTSGAVISLLWVIDAFSLYRFYLYVAHREVYPIFLSRSSMVSLLSMFVSLLLLTGLSFSVSAMGTRIVSALQGGGEN